MSVFCSFFWHLSVHIFVSTTPSSMTHYALIPFFFNLLCSPPQYFFLPFLWTSTPILQPFTILPPSPRFLSWWNCLSLSLSLSLSFADCICFFLQPRTLSCSFIAFPLPLPLYLAPRSRLPPHISFHLSRQSASWLTYSRVGRKENEQRAFARASKKSLTDEWFWVKALPAGTVWGSDSWGKCLLTDKFILQRSGRWICSPASVSLTWNSGYMEVKQSDGRDVIFIDWSERDFLQAVR